MKLRMELYITSIPKGSYDIYITQENNRHVDVL